MSRLRDQDGFTLVELIVAAAMMMIIMAAALTALEAFQRSSVEAAARSDSQDLARQAVDRTVRQLRLAASRPGGLIELATGTELAYQEVGATAPGAADANNRGLQRVRLCLNTTTGKLWRQVQTWTTTAPALPAAGLSCPSASWAPVAQAEAVAGAITNGAARPLFSFDYRVAGSTAPADVSAVTLDLYLDNDPTRRPGEVNLRSTVYLRNGNRPPLAAFTDTQVNGHVILNASPSQDPEGEPLVYAWYVDGSGTAAGTYQRLDTTGYTTGSSHTFTLRVTDAGGLTNDLTRTVVIK